VKKVLRIVGRILLGLLVLVVVALVAARLAAPGLVESKVPKILAETLGVDVALGNIDFALITGSVAIDDFSVEQPEGFNAPPLITVDHFSVSVDLRSLMGDEIVVNEILWNGGDINLVKTREGVLNATKLVPASDAHATDDGKEVKLAASDEIVENKPAIPFSVRIRKVTLKNINLHYVDATFDEKMNLDVTFTNITLDVTNLVVFGEDSGEDLPGQAVLRIDIAQKGMPAARIGLRAAIGVIGEDIPALNAVLLLGNLSLETLGPLIPAGVETALGGDNLHSIMTLSMATNVLRAVGETKTEGSSFDALITGTPKKPEVQKTGLLFNVMARGFGGIGNVAGNMVASSGEVVATAGKTGAAVVKGAANTVGSIGKGLFKTLKGVATLNIDKTAEGLKQTTIGSVSEAGKTVTGAGSELTGGLKNANSAAHGSKREDEWLKNFEERWAGYWDASAVTIKDMPYPSPKINDKDNSK